MALAASLTRQAWMQMEREALLRNRLAHAFPNLKDDAPIKLSTPGPIAPTEGPGDRA
jgi:hypothetical protein